MQPEVFSSFHPSQWVKRLSTAVGLIASTALLLFIGVETGGAQESGSPLFPPQIEAPLGLPEIQWPEDNEYSPEKAELGWYLYYDPRLSEDETIACATCHSPAFGFTDGAPVSTGIAGQTGGRSAPVSFNQVFNHEQFWDGRAPSLEAQVVGPIANPIEMGFTHQAMVDRLNEFGGYRDMFEEAFGSPEITVDNVAEAIATFERTLLSGNSAYDRYQAGDLSAMNGAQINGMRIFQGKANCDACHGGPNFTYNTYHNLGVGMGKANPDLGRNVVTQAAADTGAFKTPTLREISRTGPYMHDGSLKSLEEVVAFYNVGGFANEHRDRRMMPLGLTPKEQADLVAFLRALDGTTLFTKRPTKFPK